MRCWLYLCFIKFLCNDVFASEPSQVRLVVHAQQRHRVVAGGNATISLRRESGSADGCWVTPPFSLDTYLVTETSGPPGVVLGSRPTSSSACNIIVGPVDSWATLGQWILKSYFQEDDIVTEARQPFVIEEDDGIAYLPLQDFWIHKNAYVDISLDAIDETVTCFLKDPDGIEHDLENGKLNSFSTGVEVRISRYTSCAVTIGPVDDSLLGIWTLIERKENSVEDRYQPARLQWADLANPGSWQVATEIVQRIVTKKGSSVTISVSRPEGFFQGCFLTTPNSLTLPVYTKDYPGITFVTSNFVSACIIEIGPVDTDMFGDWILAARFNIDGIPTEIQQPINIEDDQTTILPRITHVSYLHEYVDINLNQTGVTGRCLLTEPTGETVPLYSINIQGVQAQNSSHLVSCRVTIGPITQELLGEWTLIEQLNDESRQQSVTIVLASTDSFSRRQVIIALEQSVTVQLGDIISRSVGREDGLFEGCFLTAPDGTTVPVFANMRYPGITLNRPNRFASCVVAIGPVDNTTFGRWTLFAIYNAGGERIESRQPFNILQDDGTTTLSTITHLTHKGAFIDINLNQTGTTGGCVLKSPNGTEHVLPTRFDGVTVHHSSKFVSCRVTIGPMVETLLGDWVLIQRPIGDRERKQPVSIYWANPSDPEKVSREVIYEDIKNSVGVFGDIIPISASRADGILNGCYLTTPDGAVLRIAADRRYPGVSFRRGNSISSCNAAIGPIDNNMEGNWTMSARFDIVRYGRYTETRQLVVVSRNTTMETVLPRIDQLTNFGALIDININAVGNIVQSCSLVTSDDEIYKLDESFYLVGVTLRESSRLVTCHVTIGPMTAQLLGQWTLIEHLANGFQRRRSVNIAWANPTNPVSEPRQIVIDAQHNIVLDAGATTTVSVGREQGFDEGCFVVTPDGYVLPISEVTSYPGVTWNLRPTSVSACSVTFGPVDEAITGRWILGARFNNGGVRIEKQQPIKLALADGTTTLSLLEYLTHSDAYVDINLNRTDNIGICYLKYPTGAEYYLDPNITLPGVIIHDSDLFVSCRVTIGPMSDDLLGEWSLIEKQTSETRIQPVSITWINPANPHEERSVTKIYREHFLSRLGSILSISIGRQDGTFEGCFITTPDQVCLPVFPNTEYPAVKYLGANNVTSCRIQIGPVHSYMAGEWTLSAKFNNHGLRTELQKTIYFHLRDNSSIFITPMPRQIHLTNVGATVDISLSNKGGVGNCRLTTPAEQEYLLVQGLSLSGVTVQRHNEFVSCRVTIGPMTEDLLGEWILIQEDIANTARKQIVRISWANPWEPTTEARQLVISSQQNNAVKLGETVTVSVRREGGFEEGCSVITPDGTVLPVSESFSYPRITWHFGPTSVSACSVVLGPMNVDMVGTWSLAARFNKGGIRVETRQPVDLIIEDGILTLPLLDYLTHLDSYVNINLNQTGFPGYCTLIDPIGQQVTWNYSYRYQGINVAPSDHFVSCNVFIGPMRESLLGKWTLIEEFEDGTQRHQPVFISWINPSNPKEERGVFTDTDITLYKALGSITSMSIGRLDGVLEGCFLIRLIADNEILLPVFPYTGYPDIMFIGANDVTSCIVQIGPINVHTIGQFRLIARYNNYGTRTEIRKSIFLLPRDEFLTANSFPRQVHLTNIGETIDISLKRTRATGNCRIMTPTGREYIIDVPVALSGVTVQSSNKFVSCRVIIGPMTEELLGDWILSQDGDETLYQQPARLLWANPWNPSGEALQLLIATEQNSVVEVGNNVTVSIRREEGFEEGCFLITPDGAVLPISETFNHPGFALYSRPTGVAACNVKFGPMNNDMVGTWILGARFNNGGRRFESRQPIRFTLKDGATILPTLEYLIHKGMVVDINLNQTGTSGACILRDTNGQEFTLTDFTNLPGVTVHSSNRFVSCRLSLGPVDDTLLGEWTLIHRQTDGRQRLQPVIVSWINPMNPSEIREVKTGSEQNIRTNIGNIVSTSIERQNGLFEGCFMTTPDGTLLPVFHNTRYPGVVLMGTNSVTACTVQVGPVHGEMAGKWTLAARFNQYGARYELQNIMNIIIDEAPSLDATSYPRQEHLTYIGANVEISLSQRGVNGNCHLTTPNGEEYALDGPVSLPGVTVHSHSEFVSCRVTIGPITDELLGNWILSQQDSVSTLRQQPVTISWANPFNPSEERQLIITAQQNSAVDSGQTLNVSIRREDGFDEGCFVTTPNGEVLPVSENMEYPGITWAYRPTSFSACNIGLGPMDADMVGQWIVAARFNNAGIRFESRQPINLVLGDGTTSMPVVEYLTYVGENVDLVLNQTQISGTCYLKTPEGEEHSLITAEIKSGIRVHNSNEFVSCRVTIGPMTESLLGRWTLIERHDDATQRLQLVTITWANRQDPYTSREIISSEKQAAIVNQRGTVTLNGERHLAGQFEGCFITTPDGSVLPIFANHHYPGIGHAGARSTAPCVVELGPVDSHMVGEWTLASRFNVHGERVERLLSVYVYINGGLSPESLTILVVVLCVVCPVLLAVGGVMAFKRTRQWTKQHILGLRSSFRSNGSRNEIINNQNPVQEIPLPRIKPTKSKA